MCLYAKRRGDLRICTNVHLHYLGMNSSDLVLSSFVGGSRFIILLGCSSARCYLYRYSYCTCSGVDSFEALFDIFCCDSRGNFSDIIFLGHIIFS